MIDISNLLSKSNANSILVIGDIILDEYIKGVSDRLSPESPVPIVNVNEINYNLGGAANVSNNIHHLNNIVYTIGLIGKDDDGKNIINLFKKNRIKTTGLVASKLFNTIKKTRVIGNNHQIVRYDIEKKFYNVSIEKKLLKKFDILIKKVQLVIISDYGKGVCSPDLVRHIIKICKKNKINALVDPRKKFNNFDNYRNSYLITPNLYECRLLYPDLKNIDKDIEKAILLIKKNYNISNIVITRSEKGMSLLNEKYKITHYKSDNKDIYDVSGAGDTVIATLGVLLSKKIEIGLATQISNYAAGIAVSFYGTVPVNLKLLVKKLKEERI